MNSIKGGFGITLEKAEEMLGKILADKGHAYYSGEDTELKEQAIILVCFLREFIEVRRKRFKRS